MESSTNLRTTSLINSSNPTVAAVWDVGSVPERGEAVDKIRLRFSTNNNEDLGPQGDRRLKVDSKDFGPGGKYRAICKLFMGYTNSGDTYIGTGWLIADDLVVTAGHCSYDSKLGFLKWMKVYIGYAGDKSVKSSSCQYREASNVALPVEYLKVEATAHDVSFVKLKTKFSGVNNVIKYQDTPEVDNETLGIVGYPGDLNFGSYMYEQWDAVHIDLAESHGILEYRVDTTKGQSGSPVFRKDLTSIGVHVAGGWPNKASVIGTLGNIFEEYRLALKIHAGFTASGATIVPPTTKPPVRGYQMIRITSLSKEAAKLTGADKTYQPNVIDDDLPQSDESSSESEDDSTDKEAKANETMKFGLERLFGSPDIGQVKSHGDISTKTKAAHKVAQGKLLEYPEFLVLKESESINPVSNADAAAATLKGHAKDDIQTVFFVNFPLDFADDKDARAGLIKVQDLVQSWQAWSSSLCEGKVQDMINSKVLPADNSASSMTKRSSYRAKVFDYLMRQATWFAKTYDELNSKHITCKKLEFHGEIFKAALAGFTVPASVYSKLESVINVIVDGVAKASSEKSSDKMQLWLMLTRYNYEKLTGRVQPVIRIISFIVTQETRNYTLGKSKYDSVDFEMAFQQVECDFNAKIYEGVSGKFDRELIKKGRKLAELKTTDIEVSVDP